jgi:hypothetical protein
MSSLEPWNMAGPGAAAFARAPFLLDLILRQTSDNKEIKLELSAGDDSEIHLVLDCLSDFTVLSNILRMGIKTKTINLSFLIHA